MDEKAENTAPKQRIIGTPFPPGVSGNPAGRPKGSISIKEKIKQHLEENPLDVQEIVKHFVKENRELMWQMLEGSPKATTEVNQKSVHLELTGRDLLLAQELERTRQKEIHGTSTPSDGSITDSVGGEIQNKE